MESWEIGISVLFALRHVHVLPEENEGFFRFPKYSFANIHLCQKIMMCSAWISWKIIFLSWWFSFSLCSYDEITHLWFPGWGYLDSHAVFEAGFWGSMGWTRNSKESKSLRGQTSELLAYLNYIPSSTFWTINLGYRRAFLGLLFRNWMSYSLGHREGNSKY